ncbi:hypothetical protein O5282_18615 [Escherichia coli]|nr:hypothetical protein [Escherichia coli]
MNNLILLAYPPEKADEIKGLDLLLSGAYDGILLSFFDSHTMRVMDLKIKVSENLPCECLKKFVLIHILSIQDLGKVMKQWMNSATML